MDNISSLVNIPVRSLQTYLRRISKVHREVSPVIPDGKYGAQTENAVRSFQQKYGLPPTGTADHETWQRVVEVYRGVLDETAEPAPARIYPSAAKRIAPGEAEDCLYAIQGMMLPLTRIYPELGTVGVTGVNDDQCAACVQNLQRCFGQEENGVIDKRFWNSLAGFYTAQVSGRRPLMPQPTVE